MIPEWLELEWLAMFCEIDIANHPFYRRPVGELMNTKVPNISDQCFWLSEPLSCQFSKSIKKGKKKKKWASQANHVSVASICFGYKHGIT